MRDADRAQRTAEQGGTRLYVDGGARMFDVGEHLATAHDGSLDGYLARLSGAFAGRTFELVINDFQAFSVPLWRRLRALLAPIYARSGLPSDRADAVLFLRNHASGFGLHRDRASTFMFVLRGRKRVHLWAPELLADMPVDNGTQHYAPLLDRAHTLEAEAGGAVYWPSSHFHCIVADPGISLSISVGLRLRAGPASHVLRALEHAAERASDAAGDTYEPGGMASALDVARERIARLAASAEFADALAVACDDRVSGAGFARVPAPLEVGAPPSDRSIVAGSADYPVLLRRLSSGRLSCSANGRSFSTRGSAAVERLVARLNAGVAITLRELIASTEPADAEERLLLRRIVAKLRSLRAVEVVG